MSRNSKLDPRNLVFEPRNSSLETRSSILENFQDRESSFELRLSSYISTVLYLGVWGSVLAVEILALKLCHDPDCTGIILPNLREARLTQFTDDTTVISSSVASRKASLQIINRFGSLSGLNLNKTKIKVMWICSQKGNKDKTVGFKCITEPIKALGAFLSYDGDKNNEEKFFSKIRKMKTKLNIWQTRDLSLYCRSMLVKTVCVSQLIYAASMLTVPEPVIQKTQAELFTFLWRNKKDKIKRDCLSTSI